MKERKKVTFIKNNKETSAEINLFTKKSIGEILFTKQSAKEEFGSIYYINDDIEYLELNNIIFPKDVRFIVPNNSILVLNNCTFKTGNIDVVGGNIDIVNPILNEGIYTNRISLSNVGVFNLLSNNKNKGYITLNGNAKEVVVRINNTINKVALTTEKIFLQSIKNIKEININSQLTILKNCDIEIDENQQIVTNSLVLDDSQMIYQTNTSNATLEAEIITMKDSIINFNSIYTILAVVKSKIISLINSEISSRSSIKIDAFNITIDDKSKLLAEQDITINKDRYTRKKEDDSVEINSNNQESINAKRKLISTLKTLTKRK